jgi:hypothetical protein
LNRIPIVRGRVLDLAKLFDIVSNIGGSTQIKGTRWTELSVAIGLQAENAQIVEDSFQRLLSPLEKYRVFAGTAAGGVGVQNQQSITPVVMPVPEAQSSASTSSTVTIDAQRAERQRLMREQMAREEQQRKRAEQLRQEQQEYERKLAMKEAAAPPSVQQQPPPPPPPLEPTSAVPQQEPQMILKISRPIVAPTAKRPRTSAGSAGGGVINTTTNSSLIESSQQIKMVRHSRSTEDLKPIIANLYSTDLQVAINAINKVLVKSSDTDQPLLLEEIPELLPSLCYLLDVYMTLV